MYVISYVLINYTENSRESYILQIKMHNSIVRER